MSQFLKGFGAFLCAIILAACSGGGGGLESGTPAGGDGGTSPTYVISLSMENAAGETTNVVQASAPLQLHARLSSSGTAIASKTISFENSGPGVLSPTSKLTGSDGIATIQIAAGSSAGAGTITASYNNSGTLVSQTIDYEVELDNSGGGAIPVMTLSLLAADDSAATVVTSDQPLRAVATVTLEGVALANKVVSFTTNGLGELNPPSKLTDANGAAVVELSAGSAAGAGTLSASYQYGESASVTQSTNFEVQLVSALPQVSLALEDSSGSETSAVSQASPGRLLATVSYLGEPVVGGLVQFGTNPVGVINPSLGTAITDANGVAAVTLLPGTQEGASTASASYQWKQQAYSAELVFQTAGDAPEQSGGQDNLLSIALLDSVGGSVIADSIISENQPGYIEVTARNSQGAPLAGQVATYTSTLGNFIPATGTALTDANGVATIVLQAGSVEGAGEVKVNIGGATTSVGFITLGDVIDPDTLVPQIDFAIYNCPDGWDRNGRDFVNDCTVTDNITNTEPGIIGITVTQAGSTQPLTQSLVLATTTLGGISPAAGTAVTDSNGRAILDLYANGDVGAGEITVSVSNQQKVRAFEIGRVDVNLVVSANIGNNALPAGGSTIIEIQVQNPDSSLAVDQPFAIELTSDCIVAGTSVVDTPVNTVGGIAFATYRATGCNGTDLVTASAQTGGTNVTGDVSISVTAAEVGSIQYVSAVPTQLALRGSGGIADTGSRSETAVVTFKLLDETAAPATQQLVCFELATDVGGIELTPSPTGDDIAACSNIPNGADLTKYAAGYTNAAGEVSATVKAGTVATPVKVFAMWSDGVDTISNVSDELAISTGLADNNSFSVSASVFNPEGWAFDNETVSINILAADHFNNPVPDGTVISFWAEGGAVAPNCTTQFGACTAEWRSQDPRPFASLIDPAKNYSECSVLDSNNSPLPPCVDRNADPSVVNAGVPLNFDGSVLIDRGMPGRATILAFAIGEESFTDLNGNGLFDTGEPFGDLSEAYRDDNNDGFYRDYDADGANPSGVVPVDAATEEFVDFDLSQDYTGRDGLYTGLLCAPGSAASCTDTGLGENNAHLNVRRNLGLVMSGSTPFGKLAFKSTPSTIINGEVIDLTTSAAGKPSESVMLYLTDLNNNPLPVGTTITASTSNGVLVVGDSYEFPNTAAISPLAFSFTVERETEPNDKTDGLLVITVKTPKGVAESFTISVLDDG